MPASQAAAAPVLRADCVSKSFGKVPVLFSIDLDIMPGQVHSLIGENGAGKTTLMKVLAGFHAPTSGQLYFDGEKVSLPPNGETEKLGIVLIHQELNLAEQMTVVENVFLGRELKRKGMLQRAAMASVVEGLLQDIGLEISPYDRVSDLSIAEKQMVEIIKAISRHARILIMDEPTAVLTESETELFFSQIERLKANGVAIIFVSHKLGEVMRISDQVTVLRDGQLIGSHDVGDLTMDTMARMMVGRELSDLFPPLNEIDVDAELVLEVKNLSTAGVRNVSFHQRKGEILGFSGLIGSGRSALFEAICGLNPIHHGEVFIDGELRNFGSVAQARDEGVVYLTKDRKGKGLLLDQTMQPNLTLFALPKFIRRLSIDKEAENAALSRAIRRFDIRALDVGVRVGDLSGGNQQKLLLAKIMECEPSILIFDEPTRGIDVGTKQQIYHFIAALAAEGVSVIVVSSEMPEIIGVSHRVIVMRNGEIAGELTGDDINEYALVRYATGLKKEIAGG